MFDVDKYEPRLHKERPTEPTYQYDPVSNIEGISLLFWAEHCVECAAPACYQSCDLYQARPDKRCRRFTYGAFQNPNFPCLRGYGVEISFKKWAKIEAFGNLSIYPVGSILLREKVIRSVAPVANAIGKAVGSATKNDKWSSVTYIALERLARRLHRANADNRPPDAFLLEVYNPGSEAVRLQLGFKIYESDGARIRNLMQFSPYFATTIALPSGYSHHEVEESRFHAVVASGKPFKVSLIPEGDSNARLVFLTADFVRFTKRPDQQREAKNIKCVVWDLDNTLWKGILVEGDDVVLRSGIPKLLKRLDDRGILLSIASKNDHAYAWRKLEQFGVAEYFLYPQINWAPKSSGVKSIAERLNIGLDTFAFVDDNPFELDQLRAALPDVLCVNAEDISNLFSDPRFQGSTSAEARQRRQFYKQAIEREAAQEEFGSNYLGFLASCGITLEIAPYCEEDSERVAELVQRTNQLNFSGHKYTRTQLNEVLADPRVEKYVLKSSDKYGSYGTIGFGMVEQETDVIQVRDLMLSCRVQGKFIEQAFFNHLLEHHNPHAARALWVNFHETARNKPAEQVLKLLGFRKYSPPSGRFLEGVLHSAPESLRCDFIRVQCSASTSELCNESIAAPQAALPPQL